MRLHDQTLRYPVDLSALGDRGLTAVRGDPPRRGFNEIPHAEIDQLETSIAKLSGEITELAGAVTAINAAWAGWKKPGER